MLEAAPKEERGGNSTYTAGALRLVYNGPEEVKSLVDLSDAEIEARDFGTYTEEQYFDDMYRMTRYRTDPELCDILVKNSTAAWQWWRKHGVKFQTSEGRQAFKVDGKFKFWGGLCVETWGGGHGLIDTRARDLRQGRRRHPLRDSRARADHRQRWQGHRRHGAQEGPQVSISHVRRRWCWPAAALNRTPRCAAATWARAGNWRRCAARASTPAAASTWRSPSAPCRTATGRAGHAVGWDFNAPQFGDLTVGDNFQKHSYPLGIMVNATGKRFVDEGYDFRNYTYAKYGHVVKDQPDMMAWQIFDKKVLHMLRGEYRIKRMTKVSADTLEELVEKLEGVDAKACLAELKAYNAAVMTEVPFNPAIKDGRGTRGLGRREVELGASAR